MTDKKTLTRSEVMRRWNDAKKRKQERIKRIEPSLKEQFRHLNGEEATLMEIW